MEAPHLDLTSELLGVYREEGDVSGGSSESGSEDRLQEYQSGQSLQKHNANNTSYKSSPRKGKGSRLGQHTKAVAKRTRLPLQWKQVRSFTNEAEAQKFIQNFEGFHWRKGCNNKTSVGLKCYYICKENSTCKVMSLLHYESKTGEIAVLQSDRPHSHGPSSASRAQSQQQPETSVNNGGGSVSNTNGNGSIHTPLPPTQSQSLGGPPVPKCFRADADGTNEVNSPTPPKPEPQDLQLALIPTFPTTNKKPGAGGGRRRGLTDEMTSIITNLFTIDPHIKPGQVQDELKRAGIPLLQNYHINNFLAKLRKQLRQAGEVAAGSAPGQHQHQPYGARGSSRSRQFQHQHPAQFDDYDDDDGSGMMMNGRTDYYSDDAGNSSTTDTWFNNPNPMSMVDINLTNPFENDPEDEEGDSDGDDLEDGFMDGSELFDGENHAVPDENRDTLLGLNDSMSVTISNGAGGNSLSRQNSNSFSPPYSSALALRRFSTSSGQYQSGSGVVATSTTTHGSGSGMRNNQSQSEVVSTSNMISSRPRKRNFYFRDESTKEGDNISPNEDNIKGLIVQHIQNNYSNRDMLHIREELRTLKDMKKFRALNRLLSFTAGFLQDSFLDATAGHGNETRSPDAIK